MTYNLVFVRNGEQIQYNLNKSDILNLYRAVSNEGKPSDAVTWTLINRFAWLYPTYNNLSDLITAYSQTINPRWFPDGDLYQNYIKGLSLQDKKRAQEIALGRVKNSQAKINTIHPYYIDAVDKVLSGSKNPVPGAVHFIMSHASYEDSEEKAKELQKEFALNRTDLYEPIYYKSSKYGNNWFFSVPNSSKFSIKIIKEKSYAPMLFMLYGGLVKFLGNS